jgi:hypothetical protein
MKKILFNCFLTLIPILFYSYLCQAQDISHCNRTAFIGKCENLALPENYQELFDKYQKCLGEQLNIEEIEAFFITYDSPPEDVAIWDRAQKNCEHLKPDYKRKFSTATPEIMVSNLQAEIASILTCDEFHIVNHKIVQAYRENSELAGIPVKEDKSTIPEYYFEGTYDCVKEPVIRPEKDNIEPDEEIKIYLSDFRDKNSNSSQEFNRILVCCSEGKILNGVRYSSGANYRVFKLDQQPINIKYKAPDDKSGFIQITVFNSCDILPVNKTPLRETRIGKQISTYSLNMSQAEWTGRLTYEFSTNFNCKHGTARIIEENKHLEQKADLKLTLDKLEFGLMNLGILGNVEGNGQLEAKIDDNREETGKDYHQIKQMYGSHTEPISAKNLILTIVGKSDEDPKAMQERWQQMVQSDPMAVIREMKKIQEEGQDKIDNMEIVITIMPPDPKKFTATYNIVTDSKDKQTRINETVMMPVRPMSVKINAHLKIHEDGSAELTGGYDNTSEENNGKPSSSGCPPIFVKEKVQFMLFKRKSK